MRSDREPADQSRTRGAPRRASTALLPASLVPASRRRDLGEQEQTCRSVLLETQYVSLSSYAATGASLPQRNSVPSTHMRWSTVPSLRASATFARFRPRRLATSIAQRLRVEKRVGRLSTTLAASYRAVRTIASPTLLIPPITSVSPDWYRLGVSPKWAPTALEDRNRPGSSTAVLKVIDTSAPTPGTVISRRQTASARTIVSMRRCRRMNSLRSA